ncbi:MULTISPECIES: hypothetical protein [Streptomyces]|nr:MULTISPECIES: hypothetical protein [Streptomyces]UUS30864.1 hypothetical protein NRO40_08450 [Streptomyces changanensis]
MRLLARRLSRARDIITAQAARIRELETQLDETQDRARQYAAEAADLRASRTDDALTTDLRRRLRLSERARASLDAQILTLQAAAEATARTEYDRRWAA